MGRPFSVTLDDIHMIWTENDVFKPLKPLFYKRYVDDIFRRRKKNYTDQLYHELNNYHPNINLTIEINPKMFLDTQVITQNGKIETTVYTKSTKVPAPSLSIIPKRYERNTADLHLGKVFSSRLSTKICWKCHLSLSKW